jgi:glucose/mannose transport system permease protein
VALVPAAVIVVFAYLGTMAWTIEISFTNSKMLPVDDFVGWRQYVRLFNDNRWEISLHNLVIFGLFYILGALVIGFLLAVAIDQRVRSESAFRTVFLYPNAMSFIVTGLIWQWMLNPTLGLQKVAQDLGWESFRFGWIVDPERAIYVVGLAGLWHASGLVMVLMLAGLRGVDSELWSAARVDGIPRWRVYLHIVIPVLQPMVVTAVVLLAIAAIKVYDLILAMTDGGPGIATEMPAKYVMDYLQGRANIGLATAASTVMLVTVLAVLAPWLYMRHFRARRAGVRSA